MSVTPKLVTGSTRITLTLPDDLLAVLGAAAALDNRARSNLIAHWLRGLKETYPCLSVTPLISAAKSRKQNVV